MGYLIASYGTIKQTATIKIVSDDICVKGGIYYSPIFDLLGNNRVHSIVWDINPRGQDAEISY